MIKCKYRLTNRFSLRQAVKKIVFIEENLICERSRFKKFDNDEFSLMVKISKFANLLGKPLFILDNLKITV